MRYLLYESSTDTVPLSRELAHLRSFLDLQRLRLPASAQDAIQLEVTGTSPDCAHPIAPLLLMPLVENAFKHGDLTARPVAVHISLVLASDGLVRFSVLNHVAPADAERELPKQPGGVGLVNLRRRLELLYPAATFWMCKPHPASTSLRWCCCSKLFVGVGGCAGKKVWGRRVGVELHILPSCSKSLALPYPHTRTPSYPHTLTKLPKP
ncbi:hypothetical protein MUN84_08515 [Hymenobacter sp. 5516J-16]|nr:hypothetical protein [Hymenobacter sp. 5516J-16]UOQ78572.1 hypothetical protein MUN84_08515 [Hymenobacter sp. 5516J-16]